MEGMAADDDDRRPVFGSRTQKSKFSSSSSSSSSHNVFVAYRDTGLCYDAGPLVALSEAVFAIAATFGVAKVIKKHMDRWLDR
jgi:hypothetical protein